MGERHRPVTYEGKVIGAAILAMVGVVFHGLTAWSMIAGSAGATWPIIALNLLAVVALGPGSILLLLRSRVGHWLVVAGASMASAVVFVAIVRILGDMPDHSDTLAEQWAMLFFALWMVPLGGAGTTLVLALSPSTRSWIREGRGYRART